MQAPPPNKIKTIADQTAVDAGYYWDTTEAETYKVFAEKYFHLWEGSEFGTPYTVLPFLWDDFILPMYSWKKPNGYRRYKWGQVWGPKKFSKSSTSSTLAIYECIKEPYTEIVMIAATMDQVSRAIWKPIQAFIQQSPELSKRLKLNNNLKTITDRVGKGTIRILACNKVGVSGGSHSMTILDEFAEHPNAHAREVYDRISNADMARSESINLILSTPHSDTTHIGKEQFDYAKDIIDGLVTDDLQTLPLIYGAPPHLEPSDPEAWKCHPAYGTIVDADYFAADWAKKKNSSHGIAQFERYCLGRWVGSLDAFINPAAWAACYEDFKEEDFYNEDAILCCDFGGRYDALAWTILVPYNDKFYIIPRVAYPEKILKNKIKNEQSEYATWAQQGFIKTCDGETVDRQWFLDELKEDCKRFNVTMAAFDDFNIEGERQALEDMGIDVVCVRTNNWQQVSPCTMRFEKLINEKRFAHNNNPVLNWNMQCLTIKMNDSNLIRPDKKAGRGKIDMAVSIIVGCEAIPDITNEDDWCGIA